MAAAGATPAGALIDDCACCGVQGVAFKRCSRCLQASYCGAECQKADWKHHKKDCAPPVSLVDVHRNVHAAHIEGDWRGVLKWEGRMEEMLALWSDAVRGSSTNCSRIFNEFSTAHFKGWKTTFSKYHARSYVRLKERRIPLLGTSQLFGDQGEAMCRVADMLRCLDRNSEAATWYQRVRDVGAAHGFFTLESLACSGLGRSAMEEGRHEEGLALLRNALVAAELNELDLPQYELDALDELIMALFKTNSINEVEPLVLRYRVVTKAKSERERFCCEEFYSILFSALLHGVLCLCTPRWEPLLTAASLLAAKSHLPQVHPRPREDACTC